MILDGPADLHGLSRPTNLVKCTSGSVRSIGLMVSNRPIRFNEVNCASKMCQKKILMW